MHVCASAPAAPRPCAFPPHLHIPRASKMGFSALDIGRTRSSGSPLAALCAPAPLKRRLSTTTTLPTPMRSRQSPAACAICWRASKPWKRSREVSRAKKLLLPLPFRERSARAALSLPRCSSPQSTAARLTNTRLPAASRAQANHPRPRPRPRRLMRSRRARRASPSKTKGSSTQTLDTSALAVPGPLRHAPLRPAPCCPVCCAGRPAHARPTRDGRRD